MLNLQSLPYYLATIAYCVGIFVLSHDSDPPSSTFDIPYLDKGLHAVVYGALAICVSLALSRSQRPLSELTLFWAPIVFATAYGMTDEIHQRFVPNRFFEISDMLANGAGAVGAQLVMHFGVRRSRRAKVT